MHPSVETTSVSLESLWQQIPPARRRLLLSQLSRILIQRLPPDATEQSNE